jgi:DNA-binding NarL/FixJ family response regulator
VIRVLVVDDQALVRAGFRVILESDAQIDVVGEAADGVEALEIARRTRPDVVLMDVRMPRLDGIETTRRLVADPAWTGRVLVLTTYDADEYVYDALTAGASGFLLKTAPPDELVRAVRVVGSGEELIAPEVTRRLVAGFVHRPRPGSTVPAALSLLTDREVDVLRLVAQGRSNTEIAGALVVSEATVKTHINRLFAKLGVHDRVQAVILAYETGLVVPGG